MTSMRFSRTVKSGVASAVSLALFLSSAGWPISRAYAQTVGDLERKEFESNTVTRRTPRFQWFAGLAFALLLGASVLPDRKPARKEVLA